DPSRSEHRIIGEHAVKRPSNGHVGSVETRERVEGGTVRSAERQVADCTLGIGAFDPELIASIPRHVENDARVGGEAPLITWRRPGANAYKGSLTTIVGATDLMQRATNLGRTPGLVDTQIADNVRRLVGCVIALVDGRHVVGVLRGRGPVCTRA